MEAVSITYGDNPIASLCPLLDALTCRYDGHISNSSKSHSRLLKNLKSMTAHVNGPKAFFFKFVKFKIS
jgi:hypothetical protein